MSRKCTSAHYRNQRTGFEPFLYSSDKLFFAKGLPGKILIHQLFRCFSYIFYQHRMHFLNDRLHISRQRYLNKLVFIRGICLLGNKVNYPLYFAVLVDGYCQRTYDMSVFITKLIVDGGKVGIFLVKLGDIKGHGKISFF